MNQKIKSLFSIKRTIQVDLMLAFILIAIIPVTLVNQFYYNKTRSFIEEKVKNYNNEIVKQTGRQVETLVQQIGIVEEQLTSNFTSAEIYKYYGVISPVDRVFMTKKTEDYLKSVRRSYIPIKDIYILFDDGNFYSSNTVVNRDILLGNKWMMRRMFSMTAEEIIVPTHGASYSNINNVSQSPAVVSFLKRIVAGDRTRSTLIMQIDVDYAEIRNLMEGMELDKKAVVYLEDAQGALIYPDNGNPLAASPLLTVVDPVNSDDYYPIVYPIAGAGWEITVLIPETSFYSQLDSASRNWVRITIATIIFSLVASYVLSTRITSPIHKLVINMKRAGEGNFNSVLTNSKNAEIQTLFSNFNLMVNRIDILMTGIVEKETEKTTAQFKALEAQINPHFLYNTLETIRSIALESQVKSIADMCKSLADMLRYSISRNTEFVTLGDEIRHIRNYMNIQMRRFGDKIKIEYLVDEDLFKYKIVKLILQPLVENAIFHGLETKRGKGSILISAYKDNESIYINIVDDGLGVEPEKLKMLNATFQGITDYEHSDIGSDTGIGMINVNSRVKLYYGSKYGLSISSEPGVETVIRVHIPAVQ